MIQGMNHFTLLAEDEAKTLDFWTGLLGLQTAWRPDMGFPGAWLHAGDGVPILHIVFGRKMPEPRAGVIDHMAFSARDLAGTKARFDERGWRYELRRQAESETWQFFTFDPNGARVELDFDASESA